MVGLRHTMLRSLGEVDQQMTRLDRKRVNSTDSVGCFSRGHCGQMMQARPADCEVMPAGLTPRKVQPTPSVAPSSHLAPEAPNIDHRQPDSVEVSALLLVSRARRRCPMHALRGDFFDESSGYRADPCSHTVTHAPPRSLFPKVPAPPKIWGAYRYLDTRDPILSDSPHGRPLLEQHAKLPQTQGVFR